MKKPIKERLDVLLVDRGLFESREIARRYVMAGEVTVDGQLQDKPGVKVSADAILAVKAGPRFVSRGGEKLDAALSAFNIDVTGFTCADLGASTGGFTDCLLQRGVVKVFAVDVGYGQLDHRMRIDPRVVSMERVNARYLTELPERVPFVSIDASFISLKLLLPVVKGWLTESADVVPLIKPQFEAGRGDVGKGGIVKDAAIHARVLEEVLGSAAQYGYQVRGLIRSPLKGPAGNIEFLAWLRYGESGESGFDVAAGIAAVVGADDTISQ